MKKRTTRLKRTSIVIPADTYQRGVELAARDCRSFNNYIVVLLERASKDAHTPAPAAEKAQVVG